MNTGLITCLIMSASFLFFAVVFSVLKDKGSILISGFNSLSKFEQQKYDKAKMSKDMRNNLFVWSGIFALGAAFSYYISSYVSIIAFIVWLGLFFKEVHIDAKKAFGKYRI